MSEPPSPLAGRRSGRWANEPPRDLNNPQPGTFRLKLRKGGPYVPARIWHGVPLDPLTHEPLDRSPRPMVRVADFPATDDPAQVERVWLYGERIAAALYDHMVAKTAWTKRFQPDLPAANPLQVVDLDSLRPPF